MCTTNRPVASRTSLGPLKTLTFWIGSLDLDADAGGVGEDVELLDPDDGAAHSASCTAKTSLSSRSYFSAQMSRLEGLAEPGGVVVSGMVVGRKNFIQRYHAAIR